MSQLISQPGGRPSFFNQVEEMGYGGFVAIPAVGGTALTEPTRAIIVQTAGNLGVFLADGTDNDAAVIAVTAGQIFPLNVIKASTANTAVIIGLR